MSTAWYRSNVVPSLVKSWARTAVAASETVVVPRSPTTERTKRPLLDAIEVWDTTCVVTNFGRQTSNCSVLLNPANPHLSGVSKFPYFPKGGPEPLGQPAKDAHHIMGYVTQWGGMEVGQGMMFAANVVDGLVHQLGGTALQQQLANIGSCAPGHAVVTKAVGDLPSNYNWIVHTVPPFFDPSIDKSLLGECYIRSLQLIHTLPIVNDTRTREQPNGVPTTSSTSIRVATPLIGAGCRGWDPKVAMETAASTLVKCCFSHLAPTTKDVTNSNVTLAFAIPSGELRNELVHVIDRHWQAQEQQQETEDDSTTI